MKTLSDFESIAKRNKKKTLIKTMLLSSLLTLVLLPIIYSGLNKLTSRNGQTIQNHFALVSEIAYPNITYSSWGYDATSQFSGTFVSHRFKDIDGISVPFEPYEQNYSFRLRGFHFNGSDSLISSDDNRSLYTRGSSYKVPFFLNQKREKT